MGLEITAVCLQEAKDFIRQHHRHHKPPLNWKFGAGVSLNGHLVGVVTVGRPVARGLDDGRTLEITRCCTDGTKNAASMLYAAAWRSARAQGYKRLVTYILEGEPGVSLRAAGFVKVEEIRGRSWNCAARPRQDDHPLCNKERWERRE